MSLRGFKKSIPGSEELLISRTGGPSDQLMVTICYSARTSDCAAAEYTPSETRMEYLGCRANGIICATNIIGCDDVIVQRAACG